MHYFRRIICFGRNFTGLHQVDLLNKISLPFCRTVVLSSFCQEATVTLNMDSGVLLRCLSFCSVTVATITYLKMCGELWSCKKFPPLPQCRHMSFVDFVVLPPGHGRSVADFWGWDAHEVQLRCPDGVWVVIEGDVVPGGALNLNSTNLPRPWSPRESSPSRSCKK